MANEVASTMEFELRVTCYIKQSRSMTLLLHNAKSRVTGKSIAIRKLPSSPMT